VSACISVTFILKFEHGNDAATGVKMLIKIQFLTCYMLNLLCVHQGQ
jgi:hypothetical protein